VGVVVACRRYEGALGHEVVDELHAREDDVVALGDAEAAALRVVDVVMWHKVPLHVNHEQRVVLRDLARRSWAAPRGRLEVLCE